ncbi:MAG: hypothetical protein WDZ90_01890 [Candidatus Paceibacterota bacterium]
MALEVPNSKGPQNRPPEYSSFFEEKEFYISVFAVIAVAVFLVWFFFFRAPVIEELQKEGLTPEEKQELLEGLGSGSELQQEEKKAALESIGSEETISRDEKTNILNSLGNETQ